MIFVFRKEKMFIFKNKGVNNTFKMSSACCMHLWLVTLKSRQVKVWISIQISIFGFAGGSPFFLKLYDEKLLASCTRSTWQIILKFIPGPWAKGNFFFLKMAPINLWWIFLKRIFHSFINWSLCQVIFGLYAALYTPQLFC